MKIISFQKKRGFTLIELLTVIAIIGILAAILIPSVGAVRVRAAQASSSSDMRQVIVGYQNFATAGARNRSISDGSWSNAVANRQNASNASEFAMVLAWFAELNDAGLYYINSAADVSALSVIPRVVLTGEGTTREAASEFVTPTAQSAVSYNMARVGSNAPSTHPLIWTKGLGTDGEWDADTLISPWGNRGGHIGFVGGNVEFFERIEDDLVDADDSTPTSNMVDAIRGGETSILRPVGATK